MAPDPANFVHQLPQKESGEKLYGSRSRQLSHQLHQKESGEKLYGSRSRQLSHRLLQKESGKKIYDSRSRQQSADIIRANEIAIENIKTGKVNAVLAI